MPKYTIGRTHEPLRPNIADFDITGLERDPSITDAAANQWFEEAFAKFIDDPYVELNPSNINDCARLVTLAVDAETGAMKMQPVYGLSNLDNVSLDTKKALYQASCAGHLFYYDASLGERGGMRQVYTKSTEVNGKTEQELCVTDQIQQFPAATAPKSPAWWKYIAAIFSKRYSDEIQEYKAQVAQSAKVDTYISAIGKQTEAFHKMMNHRVIREGRQEMLQNKQERIQAYEQAKQKGFESSNFKSPADFLQELRSDQRLNEKAAFNQEFLDKDNPTAGDFYRGLVKIMMVQLAKKTLMGTQTMSEEQRLEYAKEQQFSHRLIEKGLKAFVVTLVDPDKVEKICAKGTPNIMRDVLSKPYVNAVIENGLDQYFESLSKFARPNQQPQKEQLIELQEQPPMADAPQMGAK